MLAGGFQLVHDGDVLGTGGFALAALDAAVCLAASFKLQTGIIEMGPVVIAEVQDHVVGPENIGDQDALGAALHAVAAVGAGDGI